MEPRSEAQCAPSPGHPLLETQSNDVTAGRVWLRESPIGYVCIGLGPSAKLARFAFENVAPKHPFYDACRRHDRDVAREGFAKARRLGLDIPFGAFEDSALRRLAIASALLKAGFNPAEDRDNDGKWTDGAAGAAAARTAQSLRAEASLMGPLSAATRLALARIALGITGVTAVLGMIFIPTNRSLITEGTVPDHPDIKFKYDEGEGTLTIHRDGADGSTYGFSAKPGPDGVFRDDQGRAFARRLADGTIIIDPTALAGAETKSERSSDPQLCPDPEDDRPGARPKDIAYQNYVSLQINPQAPLSDGLAVRMWNPETAKYVYFDDCRQSDGTLIDAKNTYLQLLEKDSLYPWKGAEDKMVEQAERQIQAAQGRRIEWYFAEKEVADRMRDVFSKKGLNINVYWLPPP